MYGRVFFFNYFQKRQNILYLLYYLILLPTNWNMCFSNLTWFLPCDYWIVEKVAVEKTKHRDFEKITHIPNFEDADNVKDKAAFYLESKNLSDRLKKSPNIKNCDFCYFTLPTMLRTHSGWTAKDPQLRVALFTSASNKKNRIGWKLIKFFK